jgi:GxxExxY protein
MPNSIHPNLGGKLSNIAIGAAISVHRALGPGLDELDYEQALHLELTALGVRHECQVPLRITYKGVQLDCGYRMDVVVSEGLLLELKAVDVLHPIYDAQMLTYLRLSGVSLGLLLNFKVVRLKDGIHRRANSVAPPPRQFSPTEPSQCFDELSRQVIAAALEVQHVLGHGLLRSAYEACLLQELKLQGLRAESNLPLNIVYL